MPEDKYRTSTYQYQPVDQAQNIANKQRIIDIMQRMVTTPLAELHDVIRAGYHPDDLPERSRHAPFVCAA